MNGFVERYFARAAEGFEPLEAYGLIATSIAVNGTIEDLRAVDKVFMKHIKGEIIINEKGNENESITTAV